MKIVRFPVTIPLDQSSLSVSKLRPTILGHSHTSSILEHMTSRELGNSCALPAQDSLTALLQSQSDNTPCDDK